MNESKLIECLELLVIAVSKSNDEELTSSLELIEARQILIDNGIEL